MLPELEGILKDSLGVIVYQEQVMQIANVLASYSLGEADLLRRAMGKKNAEGDGEAARPVYERRGGAWASEGAWRAKSSIRWRSSRATDSTSRTRRRMRWWRIRRRI